MPKHSVQIQRDEHDESINAKKVSLVSASTIYAVVNTSAAGQASVALDNSVSNIGFATVAVASAPTLYAVVNTAAAGQSSVVLDSGTSSIGFATVAVSTPTLYAVVNTAAAGQASVVLDASVSKIGFTTVAGSVKVTDGSNTLHVSQGGEAPGGGISIFGEDNGGVVRAVRTASQGYLMSVGDIEHGELDNNGSILDTGPVKIGGFAFGGVPASVASGARVRAYFDTQGYQFVKVGPGLSGIGFATVAVSTPTLYAVVNTAAAGQSSVVLDNSVSKIGFATTYPAAAWPDPKTYIGLVTVTGNISSTLGGNVTLDAGSKTGIVGNVTLSDSKTYVGLTTSTLGAGTANIGFATVSVSNTARSITGNLTLSDPKSFIGLVSVSGFTSPLAVDATGQGDVPITLAGETVGLSAGVNSIGFATVTPASSWTDPKTFIGLVTAVGNFSTTFSGNVTLDAGSATHIIDASGDDVNWADVGNDAIRVNVVAGGAGVTTVFQGGSWGLTGNVTLSDSKTYIGLVTSTLGTGLSNIGFATVAVSTPTLFAVVNTAAAGQSSVVLDNSVSKIGFVTVHQGSTPWTSSIVGNVTLDVGSQVGVVGNVTLSDAKNYIGLTTTTLGAGLSNIGFATVNVVNLERTITGNVTLSDAKTYIGLVTATLGASVANIGFATTNVVNLARTITGNVTLSDAKTYIGLVTATYAPPISTYTSFATVLSASGSTTIFQPPSGKRWVLKDLHIGSLGSSEITIKSGAGIVLPPTSFATQGGMASFYGEAGLAADAADLSFVVQKASAATISFMANVRFE